MATLIEMEHEVTDAIRALTSGSVIGATDLGVRFPAAFTPEEHTILSVLAERREQMVADLQRLRERLNAAIARSDANRARDEAWRRS